MNVRGVNVGGGGVCVLIPQSHKSLLREYFLAFRSDNTSIDQMAVGAGMHCRTCKMIGAGQVWSSVLGMSTSSEASQGLLPSPSVSIYAVTLGFSSHVADKSTAVDGPY